MVRLITFCLAVIIALSIGLAPQASAVAPPQTRQLSVNGVELSYIEQGTGAPVVFVHGAWMDLRFWEPQREDCQAVPLYRLQPALPRYGRMARRWQAILSSDPRC